MNKPLLSLRGVSLTYPARGASGPVAALREVTLDVAPGEFIVLAGPSAAGKSTLAHLLAGLRPPTAGIFLVDGLPLPLDAPVVPGAAMLFQHPENTFVAPTLEEDATFGAGDRYASPVELRRGVREALERVGLAAAAHRHPADLSGGQQQLAALAGVLVRRPRLLVMDEATSYLDARHRRRVLTLVRELNDGGVAVVMAAQEIEELWLGTRLVVLNDGRVAFDGWPGELLMDPDLCRRLGVEVDPLVELAEMLRAGGMSVPVGVRPTIELLEGLARAGG